VSIARGIAPGLNRSFLFKKWPDFDNELWEQEKIIAKELFVPQRKLPKIVGCEQNIEIANQAKVNILDAGLEDEIEIRTAHFRDFQFPKSRGIIVCNPPYGKRIGNQKDLEIMYKEFGNYLKENASGWDLWLLNGNAELSVFLGMKCSRRLPISNGGIDCRWMHYQIH